MKVTEFVKQLRIMLTRDMGFVLVILRCSLRSPVQEVLQVPKMFAGLKVNYELEQPVTQNQW